MGVGLLSSVSALAIVGYGAATIFHGQFATLIAQLGKDWHFIAVPISAAILFALYQNEYLKAPVGIFIGMAIFTVILKLSGSEAGTSLTKAFSGLLGGI